jgi:hypothetical protein
MRLLWQLYCEVWSCLSCCGCCTQKLRIQYWDTGAWMAGMSAQVVRLDVPILTKKTHCVLLMFGDLCWHIDTGVLEQQTAVILDCPREGCSVLSQYLCSLCQRTHLNDFSSSPLWEPQMSCIIQYLCHSALCWTLCRHDVKACLGLLSSSGALS